MTVGDEDRRRLNAYAAKVASELVRVGFVQDVLELNGEDWKEERSGLFGLNRKKVRVKTAQTLTPGWRLATDFYEQRDVYDTDFSGSRAKRGKQSHELVTRDQIWLAPSGQLLAYFVTHEIVFAGFRHLDYLSRDHSNGPAQDWHLIMYDHWRRTHTRPFARTDMVKETITNNGRQRYPHRFQGVSTALTDLRKRAGTYVPPRSSR